MDVVSLWRSGWRVAAALATAAALAGCPAAHGDYPGTACAAPTDCFENEACVSGACVPLDDAGGTADTDGGADLLLPADQAGQAGQDAADGASGDADAG